MRIPSTVTCGIAAALCASIGLARADDHRQPRPAATPRGKEAGARYVGTHVVPHPEKPIHEKDNPPHQVVVRDEHNKRDEKHVVVVDHRPAHVIDRDARLRVAVRGYHSKREWSRFHRARGGWFRVWGVAAWDTVGTVTCEAANETTGEMYPVSMDRDTRGWDDDSVNSILDQALDDCIADANGATCGPATPACTFQAY